MARNSYFGGGGYTAADTYAGLGGAGSPDAILNALRESKTPTTDDPFGNLLEHANDFGPNPYAQAATASSPTNDPWSAIFGPPPMAPPINVPAQAASPFAGGNPVGTTGTPVSSATSPFSGGNAPPATNPAVQVDQWGIRINPGAMPPKPPNTEDPNIAANWYSYLIPGITGADVVKYRTSGFFDPSVPADQQVQAWWRAGKPMPSQTPQAQPAAGGGAQTGQPSQADLAKREARAAALYAWVKAHPGQPFPGFDANGNVIGTAPGATPPPSGAAGGGTTGAAGDPMQGYLEALNHALDATYNQALQESVRGYRAGASAQGLENTGAYGANEATLRGGLANTFATEKAKALLGAREAERQREFTGEQNNLDRALQRFGIQLNADTSRANAQTAAGAQQIAAQLQYQLGLQGIQVDRDKLVEQIRNDSLGYNLGLGQQDLNRLLAAQSNQLDLFRLIFQYGPEETVRKLLDEITPPGYAAYSP